MWWRFEAMWISALCKEEFLKDQAEHPQDGHWKGSGRSGGPFTWNNTCKSPLQSVGRCRISRNYFVVSGDNVDYSETYYPFQFCIFWSLQWIGVAF